jgi:hypothetical protein
MSPPLLDSKLDITPIPYLIPYTKVYKLVHTYNGKRIPQEDNGCYVVIRSMYRDAGEFGLVMQKVDKSPFKFPRRGQYKGTTRDNDYLFIGTIDYSARKHQYYHRWGLIEVGLDKIKSLNIDYSVMKPLVPHIPIEEVKIGESYNIHYFDYRRRSLFAYPSPVIITSIDVKFISKKDIIETNSYLKDEFRSLFSFVMSSHLTKQDYYGSMFFFRPFL